MSMYMFVHADVYVYLRVYLNRYLCAYVCANVGVGVCLCVYSYLCRLDVYVCAHVCIHAARGMKILCFLRLSLPVSLSFSLSSASLICTHV